MPGAMWCCGVPGLAGALAGGHGGFEGCWAGPAPGQALSRGDRCDPLSSGRAAGFKGRVITSSAASNALQMHRRRVFLGL